MDNLQEVNHFGKPVLEGLDKFQIEWAIIKHLFRSDDRIEGYVASFGGVDFHQVNSNKLEAKRGGSDKEYPSKIPSGEIWINNELQRSEHAYTALHQYCERCLISEGRSSEDAHLLATDIEKAARANFTNDGLVIYFAPEVDSSNPSPQLKQE